jgi:hypothetical protein
MQHKTREQETGHGCAGTVLLRHRIILCFCVAAFFYNACLKTRRDLARGHHIDAFKPGRSPAMKVALWAEIRRFAEIENFRYTVAAALELDQLPKREAVCRGSLLDAHRSKIDALLAKYPELSAVRICKEIARGSDGYTGSACTLRRYLRTVRPREGASTRKPTTSRIMAGSPGVVSHPGLPQIRICAA